MTRNKKVSLSIRTTPEIKELLRLGAERERRSAASMIEALVIAYARQHGLVQAETIHLNEIKFNRSQSVSDLAVIDDQLNEEQK